MVRLGSMVVVVAMFLACNGSTPPVDDPSDPTGPIPDGLPTSSTGPWAESPADRIPCGQILDCRGACKQDPSCLDECYQAAAPRGRSLVDVVDTCWFEHGCQDVFCLQNNCPDDYQACITDESEGGVDCFARGVYEVCDVALCTRYETLGGGWGSTVSHAQIWATVDCTMAMNDAQVLASFSGQYTVGTLESCQPTTCQAH